LTFINHVDVSQITSKIVKKLYKIQYLYCDTLLHIGIIHFFNTNRFIAKDMIYLCFKNKKNLHTNIVEHFKCCTIKSQ